MTSGGAGHASSFRADIQGLRAIAVGAVLLYHAGVPGLTGGYVGVDVFFVISGMLITSHLLTGLERDGRVHFAIFYARRARRILPASFLVLVLSVVAALIWYPPLLMEDVWRGAVATAVYMPNVLFAVDGTNYLAETTPSLFQHYWSLGIEEQFYLFWPLALALGWRFIRSRRALFVVIVAIAALSFAVCIWLTFRSQPWAFFSLPARAWELGAGGVVAFVLSRRPQPLPPVAASALGWAGVVGIVASVVLFSSATPFPGYWALLPVASTALVILAGATPSRFAATALLSIRPLVWIGAISYSLYLVHWPALLIPRVATGSTALPLWLSLLIAAACIPAAWLMYRYVENPAREARWLVGGPSRRTLLSAAVASVAAISIASAALVVSDTRPLATARIATVTAATAPPAETAFVPSNLEPALDDVDEDQPLIYSDGCHLGFTETDPEGCVFGDASLPRIAVFGDSHAAQWFPALEEIARGGEFAVETHTKSACPSVTVEVTRDGVAYPECAVWRERVIEQLRAHPPALVVISNYGNYAERISTAEDSTVAWGDGLGATLDALDVPVVVVGDTPDVGTTPALCLSMNVDDAMACAKTREFALRADTRDVERRVSSEHGVGFVDLTDHICGPSTCAPIVGNVLVYRDEHHVTTVFARLLADPLERAIRDAL